MEIYTLLGFPGSSAGKESTCNAGEPGLIPGSERSPGEGIGYPLQYPWAFLVAQMVKNLPTVKKTWLQSLGWEDPLEEGMANHSSILAWRIPWTEEEPGMLPSMGLQRVRRHLMTEEEQFAHSPYLPFLYTFPHGIFSTCTVFLISSFIN